MAVSMDYIAYGRQRDAQITRIIEQSGAITRNQLERIANYKKKSITRILQRRLTRLYELGMIERKKRIPHEPYIYSTRKIKHIDHALQVNEIICAFITQLPSLYRIEYRWTTSIMNGKVLADAQIVIYTDPDKKNRQVIWVEYEANPSKKFNKVENYTEIYNQFKSNQDYPWAVKKGDVCYFPTILIVTDEEITISVDKPRFVVLKTTELKNIYSKVIRKELM